MDESKSSVCGESINIITKLKQTRFIYEWLIEGFGNFLHRKYEVSSPSFSTSSGNGADWKLILRVRHKYPIGPHMVVSLIKMSDDNEPVGVKYSITIVSLKSKKLGLSREKTFRHCMDFDECEIASHFDLINNDLLQNDDLTIQCEMDILCVESLDNNVTSEFPFQSKFKSVTHPSSKNNQDLHCKDFLFDKNKEFNTCSNSYNIPNEDDGEFGSLATMQSSFNDKESINILLNDLESLYKSKTHADVTLVCSGIPMAAHKIVLAARSDYFKYLCSEKENSKVNISNVSSTAMEAILYYLYTAKMRPLTVSFAVEIYSASRKFHLVKLEALLFEFLKSNFTVDNATEVLQACEDLSLSELKNACLKFVNSKHSEVVQSGKWGRLIKNNPHIAGEVLLTIASFQKRNIL